MISKQLEIALEQEHFDAAWEARERKRETLRSAGQAAGGPNKTAAQVRKAAEAEAAKLGSADDSVAFGRFDRDGESIYVGNHLISTDDRDILVINWQAPAAEPFYKATVQDTCGVERRRTFQCKRNTVTDFDEVVLAQLAEAVEELTGPEQWGVDDAVLRDLDVSRSGEMRDIVQTIHAAQYDLIRTPIDSLLVVQGGPGTGKTAVALHRISWLLYNHRDSLDPEECLVVGPNATFTRYIKSVLPGLGDRDVAYRDLRSLGPQPSLMREENHDVARLKGRPIMAELLRTALWQRVRYPERTDRLAIGTGTGASSFGRDEIELELSSHRQAATYSSGRNGMRAYLQSEVSIRSRRGSTPPASAVENALERLWPQLTPQAFLRDLFASRDRLLAAADDSLSAADINRLQRPASERLSEERWSDTDVALLDELDALINGQVRTYAHIVVDEAQDLSPMQLRSVKRRSRSGSMTIVGDIAQSTGAWARDTWDDVTRYLQTGKNLQQGHLSLGYRVPRQVYEFAAQLMPLAAPEVTPPRVVRNGPADPELVSAQPAALAHEAVNAASRHAGNGRFVGLIVPDELRESVVDEFSHRDIQWGDVSEGELDKAINLARPGESKGLEFDAVVVVEPAAIVRETERGYRMLYVALTRTTKYLTVVHSGVAMPIPSMTDTSETASAVTTVDEPPTSASDLTSGIVSAAPARRPSKGNETDRATGGSVTNDLALVLVQTAARSLSEQVRASVAPGQFAQLVDHLRRELDVSAEDALDLLD